MHFMKTEGNYSVNEVYEMYPYEMELFYGLCIKDIKDRIEAKKKARQG